MAYGSTSEAAEAKAAAVGRRERGSFVWRGRSVTSLRSLESENRKFEAVGYVVTSAGRRSMETNVEAGGRSTLAISTWNYCSLPSLYCPVARNHTFLAGGGCAGYYGDELAVGNAWRMRKARAKGELFVRVCGDGIRIAAACASGACSLRGARWEGSWEDRRQ